MVAPGWRALSYFGVDQYENPDNPVAYYKTLGPEIWEQTAGRVTHFVAGGSTGGTVSGTGKYLKEVSGGAVKVLCPDPVGSVLLGAFNNGKVAHKQGVLAARSYCVEGVGKDSVPGTMNFDYVDSMISVTDKQAFDMCQRMSETEGVLAGGSGGLNVHGCVELSGRIDSGVIVTVLPDSGIKYLSKIYSTEWRKEKGFGKELEADPQREASAEIIRTALQDRDPFQVRHPLSRATPRSVLVHAWARAHPTPLPHAHARTRTHTRAQTCTHTAHAGNHANTRTHEHCRTCRTSTCVRAADMTCRDAAFLGAGRNRACCPSERVYTSRSSPATGRGVATDRISHERRACMRAARPRVSRRCGERSPRCAPPARRGVPPICVDCRGGLRQGAPCAYVPVPVCACACAHACVRARARARAASGAARARRAGARRSVRVRVSYHYPCCER